MLIMIRSVKDDGDNDQSDGDDDGFDYSDSNYDDSYVYCFTGFGRNI